MAGRGVLWWSASTWPLNADGDAALRVWSGDGDVARSEFRGHTDKVVGALMLSDGRLLSWSRDNTIRLWDSETGTALAVGQLPGNSVNGAQWVSDGRLLICCDEKIYLCDFEAASTPAVVGNPLDWAHLSTGVWSELFASHDKKCVRAHLLAVSGNVHFTQEQVALISVGRHLRFCRFMPAQESDSP